ncbi:MAG: hypothetical protein MJ082_00275 [Clostridia bacterium]|nr:hypothetical protein [Clostridia bacterium]
MAPKNYTDTYETQAFPISEISCALQTFLDADFPGGDRFINEDRAPRAAFAELRPILLGNLLKLIFRDHYWDGPLTVSLSSDTET